MYLYIHFTCKLTSTALQMDSNAPSKDCITVPIIQKDLNAYTTFCQPKACNSRQSAGMSTQRGVINAEGGYQRRGGLSTQRGVCQCGGAADSNLNIVLRVCATTYFTSEILVCHGCTFPRRVSDWSKTPVWYRLVWYTTRAVGGGHFGVD